MPRIVKDMQLEMIRKLAEADDPVTLSEKALECFEIYRRYAKRIILGEVTPEDLAITRVLSMSPEDYSMNVRHAIAARKLETAGIKVEPGQAVTYIITKTATPIQLYKSDSYNLTKYLELIRKAADTIIGYLDRSIIHTLPTRT